MRASVVVNCQSILWERLFLEAFQAAISETQGWKVWNVAVEALTGQGGEFNFGHVEPGAMFWSVVNFQAFQQAACFNRKEGFVKRCRLMGVKIVACA